MLVFSFNRQLLVLIVRSVVSENLPDLVLDKSALDRKSY